MQDFVLFPEGASSLAGQVDLLFFAWVGISAFFSLLIAGLVFYFFIRFKSPAEGATGRPEKASWPLEVTWSVIPLVIALVMFGWGTKVFFSLARPPADAVEYFVTGKQWMWKIQHPTGTREINNLHIPVGVPIKLTMTSEDVIHSFFVPAFRTKQDVLPGRYSTIWFEATKPGKYHLFCAEYCGAEHSLMGGWVYAMEATDYEAWLSGAGPALAPAESGRALFAQLACDTCHREGERARGPALEGLYGSQVTTTTGRALIADDTYLRESILNPGAQIVAGYQPLMPTFQGQVSEEQLNHLIAYIKSLTPSAAADGAATAGGASAADTGSVPTTGTNTDTDTGPRTDTPTAPGG
jgi:cytochrome c oxidase subunit 2